MLRQELSAERPQSVHKFSDMLVGCANDIHTALRHESLPNEGRTSVICKPFYRCYLCQWCFWW